MIFLREYLFENGLWLSACGQFTSAHKILFAFSKSNFSISDNFFAYRLPASAG